MKELISENSWLQGELGETREALAGCLGALYPLEALWAMLAMVAFHLVVDAGRVLWHKLYPGDMFPWDM